MKEFSWIEGQKIPLPEVWNGCRFNNLIPPVFEAYCKIIHPIRRELNAPNDTITWMEAGVDNGYLQPGERIRLRELAVKYGLKETKELGLPSIAKKLGGHPRYLMGGDPGLLDYKSLNRVINIIKLHSGEIDCYFYYHLLKTSDYYSKLYRGRIEEVKQFLMMDEVKFTPSYIWPEDRSWCFYSDVDLDFTMIGGSRAFVDKLKADDWLECMETDEDTRVDDDGDQQVEG
ncbi:hypothetical protein [Jeotgalibacillus sp. R-1-5s-1]|uniref:hypothetical protein n=1 Tax=Jeotgalibacillus sp. R-1-5s-1 TaxID=2555897 RepID=UPI00106D9B4F|nr:hypothetical protein [Jeotgalibacillus sp. R-1-5s-1]TFD93641.1 hypothetical protein E2491_14470 [Jeotgalibacillus sp. R-1-5s-1]